MNVVYGQDTFCAIEVKNSLRVYWIVSGKLLEGNEVEVEAEAEGARDRKKIMI